MMGGHNDGEQLLNVVKLYVSSTPKDDYIGFHLSRSMPFLKSSGKNEIVVIGDSKVRCWKYGMWMTNSSIGEPIVKESEVANSAGGSFW